MSILTLFPNTKPLTECLCGRTFKTPRGCRQHSLLMNRKEPGKHRAGGRMQDVAKFLARTLVDRAMAPTFKFDRR